MEYLASLFTSTTAGSTAGATVSTLGSSAVVEGPLLASGEFLSADAAAASSLTSGQILQAIGQGATLLQGVSGYQSGITNASLLKEGARSARAVGAANKNLMDARGRAALGELRAQAGAQGTTMAGSPMLVYLDSVRNAAIESQNEYYQGASRAATLKTQASYARKGGENDLWAGIIGAAGPSIANLGSRLLR